MKQFVKKGVVPIENLRSLLIFLNEENSNWISVRPCLFTDSVPKEIWITDWNYNHAWNSFWVLIEKDTLLTVKQAKMWNMIVTEVHTRIEFEEGEGIAENLKLILASNWQYTIKDILCIDSERKTKPDSTDTWKHYVDHRSIEWQIWDYLGRCARAEIEGTIGETRVWLRNFICLTLKVQEPGKSYWEISEEMIPFPDWFVKVQKPSSGLDHELIECMTVKVYDRITDSFSTLELKVGQDPIPFLEKLDEIAAHNGAIYEESPTIIKDGEIISLLEATAWCERNDLETRPNFDKFVLKMSHPLDVAEWVLEGMEPIPTKLKYLKY